MNTRPTAVSVAFPAAIPGVYDYRIPARFAQVLTEGTPVLVEVRSRRLWGMAVKLLERSAFPHLKDVLDVKPVLGPSAFRSQVRLYEWIASYYQCELGAVFRPFVRRGLLKTKAREVVRYRPATPTAVLTRRQAEALEKLADVAWPASRQILMESCGLSQHMIGALCRGGALSATHEEVVREADELRMSRDGAAAVLTEEQAQCVEALGSMLAEPSQPVLLHGITGSGKTLVYIELVKQALAAGRGAVVLVPEISLTPQTIQRFAAAVGDDIAVIHSHMSEGERRDSLEQLMSGSRRVVIGVRSAILSPVPDLGLIVVDEEHDGSYKQSEPEPRYHARDVAIMRGKLQRALVVLGSATPSLESWRNACQGKYRLLSMRSRYADATLPSVNVLDMNAEHREGNWSFLSRHLARRLEDTLKARRQVILLLNRRGYSTFLLCKDCGFIHTCLSCSVHLVFHRHDHTLRCHQCGFTVAAPSRCPKCRGEQLQYKGTGIQKAEEMLRELFPSARICRMDQDTTRRKGSHVTLVEAMARREIDILLGTQMVAKGLDFPGVALVGVLQADTGLHIPDFRASERTFQLLAQVAGRAGRADSLGEVVIQTYMPHEPSIVAAQSHDFEQFAVQELRNREELGYPPFCRLARIVVWGTHESAVRERAAHVAATLRGAPAGPLTLLGPAPAVLERVKGRYRYALLVKSSSATALHSALQQVRDRKLRSGARLGMSIDVDPLQML